MWEPPRLAAELGAVLLVILAAGAGIAARRRSGRDDPDRVGLVDWPAVQVFLLFGAFLLASIAFNL